MSTPDTDPIAADTGSPPEWDTLFTPEPALAHPGEMARQMVHDLLASRELAWRLIVRNLSAAYRKTILGYLWAFLPPLFTTATFWFLQRNRVFDFGETSVTYILYVLLGTIVWQTFHEALNAPLKMAGQSKVMLAKIHFPREALILAGIGEVSFNFLIRLLIALPFLLYYGQYPSLTWPLALIGVICVILCGTVIGVILLPVGVLYEDVEKGLPLITAIWMFLTPVVYPVPTDGGARWLMWLNPVSPLLAQTRDWLTIGGFQHFPGFLLMTAIFLLLALVGWVIYRVSLPHIIARLPS